jgi:hypothetical protein
MTVRPSDFWAPFKRELYDDQTGELVEPHWSRLIANGTTIERIIEMEAIVLQCNRYIPFSTARRRVSLNVAGMRTQASKTTPKDDKVTSSLFAL